MLVESLPPTYDTQETPVKKNKEIHLLSAETQGKTPEKYLEDLDAQYLFDHFDEIVKVTF